MIYGKTPCGLQYAVKRSGGAAAYCALSTRCGTRDEDGFHSGVAHFVEHTIFKGTKKKSAPVINGYLDRLGGELNAYTTKEEIVLHATVLKEDLGKASELLFELATTATFPADEIATEKGVVIDEINSYKDSPSEDVYDEFEEFLFKGHPLSGQILGSVASVKKITHTELTEFIRERFVPEVMAFTMVADLDEKKMERMVMKLAEKWFPGHVEDPAIFAGAPGAPGYRRACSLPAVEPFQKTVNQDNYQVNCIIGNIAPSLYQEKERMATILLCNILGGPANNSILNYRLRERNGWVYGVECNYTQYADTGLVTIYLGCDKENLQECISAIRKEVRKLQTTLLSDRKLKAAKKQLLGQLAISSDSGETQCLSMGKSLLCYGRITTSEENRQKIEAVTAGEIRDAAIKIFDEDRLSRLVFL